MHVGTQKGCQVPGGAHCCPLLSGACRYQLPGGAHSPLLGMPCACWWPFTWRTDWISRFCFYSAWWEGYELFSLLELLNVVDFFVGPYYPWLLWQEVRLQGTKLIKLKKPTQQNQGLGKEGSSWLSGAMSEVDLPRESLKSPCSSKTELVGESDVCV